MGTFSSDEDLWRFNVTTEKWEVMKTSGERPEQRSYHSLAVHGKHLYLHAGCPAKGRLGTLHSLDLDTLIWSSLPDAPGLPRGGTVLAPLSSSLVRFGGFCGHELGGPLDVFNLDTKSWTSEEITGPDKRSVHSLVPIDGPEYGDKKVAAIMTLGEREGAPAELGHNGAGFFHADVWALLQSSTGVFSWLSLPTSLSDVPEARGWFGSAPWGNKVVMQGGLNDANERLGDAWVLEVVQA